MEENIIQEVIPQSKKKSFLPVFVIGLIILAGVGTGYLLSQKSGSSLLSGGQKLIGGAEVVQTQKEFGIKDEKAFKDTAEGRIEVNESTNGQALEGSHKLIRAGGPSKTAYLTSSVVDLNQFVGKCVTIWGETFASQKVAWLLDVGRVRLMDSCPDDL